jgi:parallel beta-helix repeat protein
VSCNNLTAGGNGIILGSISSNNIVSNNSVIGNSVSGIYIGGSPNNTVSCNSITGNHYGIYVDFSLSNVVYHNNLINNAQQAKLLSSGSNWWDNGYPSGGNYWSDYNGTDEKSGPTQTLPGYDGIGDVPYIIDSNNTDSYPLMEPLTGEGVLIVQTPTGSNITVSPMANASVTFASVTAGGFTSWNTVQPPTDQFVSITCNEIRTSANYTGNVTLKFAYDPSGLSLQDQQAMKIWLWNDSSSCWVDITTSVNTTSHIVYGVSPHLSVFGITRDLGMTGDLGVQGTTTVSIPSAPPPPPHNLSVLEYYQINTTKNLGTPINLSLAYDPINIQPGQEIFTQLWLWNESSTSWVDITTNVNTTTHTVYGVSPHLSVFGITNLQSAPDGITVININCPKTLVCQGYNATISFTICNQGDFTQQNFNVLMYCNTTLLAIYPITQLEQYGQIALSINWSTTNWIKGNYSINTCSNSIRWIKVTIVGDVNGDGKVNLIDVFSVALAYGSYPGHPTWNPNYDINNDGKINLIDYFVTALNYGKTDP